MAWEKVRRFQFALPSPGVSWTYPFRTSEKASGNYVPYPKAFLIGEGWATNEVRLDFIPLEEADVEAVLYPNAPPLLLVPPPLLPVLYENWEPKGGRDESIVGNVFYATVKLVPLHGDTRPIPNAFFKFRLSEVSHEPGVCMNVPYRAKPAIPGTAVPADLNFASDPAWSITESPTEITADTVSANANAITIEVNCYDYGAYGKLSVTATTQSGKTLTARIEGYAGQTALTLPLDQNNNRIADAWETGEGIDISNPKYDAEPEPAGQAFPGDGLSFYEEYRGFQVSGVYQRLSPLKKDLFVRDENGLLAFSLGAGPGVPNFIKASGCQVHLINDQEWTGSGSYDKGKRVVNFNSSGFAHIGDYGQHGVHLKCEFTPGVLWAGDFLAKYEKDFRENLPGRTFDSELAPGNTPPDGHGQWHKFGYGPGDQLLCLVRPAIIKGELWHDVWWNTRAEARFAAWDSDPAPLVTLDAAWRTTQELLRVATTNFIKDNLTDALKAYRFRVGLVVTHELGHGVGTFDHRTLDAQGNLKSNPSKADMAKGDHTCVMRVLGDDFPKDTSDRFNLRRRATADEYPDRFCFANTCWGKITISDYNPVPNGAKSLAAGSARPMVGATSSGAGDSPSDAKISEPVLRLALATELAGNPVYPGEPLRVSVRLSAAEFLQQTVLFLAGQTNALPTNGLPVAQATNWTDRLNFSIWQVLFTTNGSIQYGTMVSSGTWAEFRRSPPDVLPELDAALPVWTCEYLLPATNLTLVASNTYALSAMWDGGIGTNGGTMEMYFAPFLYFEVRTPQTPEEQADHLGRLAYEANLNGKTNEALSLGRQALALDGGNASPQRLETYALVYDLAFAQGDFRGGMQTLADWTSLYPAGRFSEAALQINYTRQALAPQVRLITSQTGDPPILRVYGWTAQEVVAEQSADLVHWAPFSTNVVTGAGWWEPPSGINPLNRSFYRAIWRP